ncbi:MAG TPA: hypothetical protein VMZ11_07465 [Mycobacteriales bacterium]|nr:hypothetical protein [Mycobacteriales bacterium]
MRRALLLLLPVVLLASCSGGDERRTPSQRVVYREVDAAGAVSTTTVDLAPPYRARVLTRGPGGRTSGFAWDDRGLYTLGPSSAAQSAAVAPGFAGPYSGLAVSLPVAERQHLVARGGSGQVLDRPCTEWLSAEPLDGAPFAPATANDRTTSCVDPSGLLLSDSWYVGNKLVRTRTVTSIGTGPTLDGTALYAATPAPLPTSDTASLVRRAPRGDIFRSMQVPLPGDPPGFRPDASVALLDRSADATAFTREAAVLTWRRGDHLVVLRVERDLSGTSRATVRGAPVALGTLGSGHLEPVLAGLRIVVDGPRRLRLVATGDLPEAELLSWARTLRLESP